MEGKMRLVLLAGLFAVGLGVTAHADPTEDALSSKARDCITSAAPRVVVRAHDLTDAVNFLVNDLCSVEIQHANTYVQSKRTLEQLQATTAANQLSGVAIDPTTGELKTPPGFTMPLDTSTIMLKALRGITDQFADYRSTAARAVLSAAPK
jgi:hypothetical protein